MTHDEYLQETPETFGGINDELIECFSCGSLVSPFAINEVNTDVFLCNKCYSKYELENPDLI